MSVARATFEFYAPGDSRLHRVDARVKLALVVCASALTLLWVNLVLLMCVLVLTQLALVVADFPRGRLAGLWRALLPLLAIVVVVWPLFDRSGDDLLSIGPLVITDRGALTGFATALRIASVSFIFIIWLGTTDTRSLVRSFVRLGLPFKWGMSLTIGLRFIPTFAGIFATVSDAQQARGLIIEGHVIRKVRRMLPILVAALVSALRASEQLAMTLEARGFGVTPHRTVLRDIRMRAADWIVLALGFLATALLVYGTFAFGLGRSLTALASSS
jgi:energy-coupling factor transport system permease protein